MDGPVRYDDMVGMPVLVTGGASGIGVEIVEAFARQGARVAFLDRNAEAAQSVTRALAETGLQVRHAVVDLTDISAATAAVAALAEELGAFRTLVNNAGDDSRHVWDDVTPELWDDRFAVNLRHHFFLAQAVAPGMRDLGGGSIINMGSTSWMFGAAGLVAYTTAKSAIQGLTKSLARELGPFAIRVNSIAPGWVLTEKQVTRARALWPGKFEEHLGRQSIKEHLQPGDVAAAALWLASSQTPRLTGQTIIIDGGFI